MSEALQLSSAAARVLGSLMEKSTTTPEYYPLSLVALTAACNQRSSRNPVTDLSEDEIRAALDELEQHGLAGRSRESEGRVPKFEHRVGEVFNLRRGEFALLCVLLLRGPQTAGELRSRTERMHTFTAVDEVETVLQQLAQREPPLARAMAREPGAREVRHVQLLSNTGEAATISNKAEASARNEAFGREEGPRFEDLQRELQELRARVSALEAQLGALLN